MARTSFYRLARSSLLPPAAAAAAAAATTALAAATFAAEKGGSDYGRRGVGVDVVEAVVEVSGPVS